MPQVEVIEFKHLHIKRIVHYLLRILKKQGYEEADKTTFYFSIVSYLSKISELIKNFTYYSLHEAKLTFVAGKNKNLRKGGLNLSRKGIDFIVDIRDGVDQFYKFFYKYDVNQLSELIKSRDLFKNRLYLEEFNNLNKDDAFLLGAFVQIYDILLDLSELRMAIGYK